MAVELIPRPAVADGSTINSWVDLVLRSSRADTSTEDELKTQRNNKLHLVQVLFATVNTS